MIEIRGEKFYTRKEVADIFGVSYTTIYRWTRKGVLKAIKIEGVQQVFYREKDINRLLQKRKK